MANELARYEEFWTRKSMVSSTSDYRNNMENLAKDQIKSIDNVHHAIETQTFALVASQAALARTMNQGFSQINNTFEAGFSDISNQLGYMTAATNMGFLNLENTINRMNAQICDKLDALYNATIRPLLTKTRELYHAAAEAYKGGYFDDALDYIKKALDEYKTDYISWFLQGKIYAFGASKYSNVIDLDKAIDAFQNAAKYNDQYISKSDDAQRMAAEIYFNLGIVQFSKSNDLLRENKKAESDEMLGKAKSSFEDSYKYSNNMLGSLYNLARCKVLQGECDSAIRDLNTLVIKDRNYCLKVYANPDFSSIKEQFTSLINKLKKPVFISAKNDYDQINTLLSELTSLGGYTNEKVPSSFSETLPYFDILDYANDFKRIIPIVEKAITDRKAAIAKAEQEARDAKEEEARKAEEARKDQEQRKTWAQQERERKEKEKRERQRRKIGRVAAVILAVFTLIMGIIMYSVAPVSVVSNSIGDFIVGVVILLALFLVIFLCIGWVKKSICLSFCIFFSIYLIIMVHSEYPTNPETPYIIVSCISYTLACVTAMFFPREE
jgi:tetratricopeptide (TPR) repeat protein